MRQPGYKSAAVGTRRRIFNGRTRKSGPGAGIFAGAALFAAVLGAGASAISQIALQPVRLSDALPSARASVTAHDIHLASDSVAVVDGSTLRLANRVVRLAGVAAPERGESCGRGGDCAGQAAAYLATLVRDRQVACTVTGADSAGRGYAHCAAAGIDLARAVVASGWATARSEDLHVAEIGARQAHRGLWAD